jgi:arsenate reductase (thioredoxin)
MKFLSKLKDSGQNKQLVLFVCVENAGSQMAEGFFRKYSPEGYEPSSAGTRPSDINPFAIEAMKEVGIDISKQMSKTLTVLDLIMLNIHTITS